jgi:hypothetical protein
MSIVLANKKIFFTFLFALLLLSDLIGVIDEKEHTS